MTTRRFPRPGQSRSNPPRFVLRSGLLKYLSSFTELNLGGGSIDTPRRIRYGNKGEFHAQRDLKAEAEKLVKMTSGDKLKTEAYCEFADVSDQIGQATENQDTEKAD